MSDEEKEIQIVSASASPLIPSMVSNGVTARAVVWPGIGAETRSMHLIQLSAQSETRQLRHDSEAVYYVISGNVTVSDRDSGALYWVPEGGMILIEPETPYFLSSSQGAAELIGGPCPPDLGVYDGMVER